MKSLSLGLILLCCQLVHAQQDKRCNYLVGVLTVDTISKHLQLFDNESKVVRVIDRSNFFKKCRCEYKNLYIGAVSNIPLDMNTGKCLDIIILQVKNKKNSIKIDFCYTLSGQFDVPDLWSGYVLFSISKDLNIEDFRLFNDQ